MVTTTGEKSIPPAFSVVAVFIAISFFLLAPARERFPSPEHDPSPLVVESPAFETSIHDDSAPDDSAGPTVRLHQHTLTSFRAYVVSVRAGYLPEACPVAISRGLSIEYPVFKLVRVFITGPFLVFNPVGFRVVRAPAKR